jgi:hypothetical protein
MAGYAFLQTQTLFVGLGPGAFMPFNPEAAMATARLARLSYLAPQLAQLITGITAQDDAQVCTALKGISAHPQTPADLGEGALRLATRIAQGVQR